MCTKVDGAIIAAVRLIVLVLEIAAITIEKLLFDVLNDVPTGTTFNIIVAYYLINLSSQFGAGKEQYPWTYSVRQSG